MLLSAFTLFHVLLSLIAIATGFAVLYGLLARSQSERSTTIFLTTTIATSVTGFFFPYHGFTPAHALGIISLIVLAAAIYSRRSSRVRGAWGRTYVVSTILLLYLNVFVLIVQLFQKVPSLRALAPTQSEPPFQITQLAVLLVFVALTIRATVRFRARALSAAA